MSLAEHVILKAIADGIKEQVSEGAGFWQSCTGCYEGEDGHNVNGYPFSETFDCVLGGGCGECGGIGAIWDSTDYSKIADGMAAEMGLDQAESDERAPAILGDSGGAAT